MHYLPLSSNYAGTRGIKLVRWDCRSCIVTFAFSRSCRSIIYPGLTWPPARAALIEDEAVLSKTGNSLWAEMVYFWRLVGCIWTVFFCLKFVGSFMPFHFTSVRWCASVSRMSVSPNCQKIPNHNTWSYHTAAFYEENIWIFSQQ